MLRQVFAYGSLVFPAVMQVVVGRPLPSVRARAPGLRREALHGAPYPAATPDPSGDAPGRVYAGAGPHELARLDAFEGEIYDRVTIEVVTAAGVTQRAWAYVVRPEHRALLAGRPWSEAEFEVRELAAYLEGCRAFARALERT